MIQSIRVCLIELTRFSKRKKNILLESGFSIICSMTGFNQFPLLVLLVDCDEYNGRPAAE